eukprot:CAMPEP_0177762790 /NCGR_PEP_ID=MMETSP0491_2-20121128/6530_1 /TAXON_ID=63592 /ORGANISM="Tetraselmis chuii, Strain PLY429" /LENGTH=59 /DNA_ID=CAMNT_0019278863 /DNA_START=1788 /DNA_END=1967 /DNA_ORIENTATION=-
MLCQAAPEDVGLAVFPGSAMLHPTRGSSLPGLLTFDLWGKRGSQQGGAKASSDSDAWLA